MPTNLQISNTNSISHLRGLPYGVADLDPVIKADPATPFRRRCFVRGCKHALLPPSRSSRGETCPDHGIRCHKSGTYSYADVRHNIIVDADLLTSRVIGNPFKYETSRLGQENSEDALSWNAFRSFQRAGRLHQVASVITGMQLLDEPRLYLWGLSASDDSFQPWNLLVAARERFESNLPVKRPLTEPDIALYLPGKYLILIEAKLSSWNPSYTDGPRKDAASLTKDELLAIYADPGLTTLDVSKAVKSERVFYQLWRNMIFAEWMAKQAEPGTRGFVANLTRVLQDQESCQEFSTLLTSNGKSPFCRTTWERLIQFADMRLAAYLNAKTVSLQKAFQ